MKTYVVSHGPCHDGLAGAWVAKKFDPSYEVFFTSRQNEWKEELGPLLQSGDFVFFIDYTPNPSDLEDFQKRSIDFMVLDHHETDFRLVTNYDKKNEGNLMSFCKYDLTIAGCQVAWNHFFPNQPLPNMLKYIAIADIYAWGEGEWDHAIVQYIRTILEPDATIEEFDMLLNSFNEEAFYDVGKWIYRRICKEVDYMAKKAYLMDFDGVEVLGVNSSLFHSEVGHELAIKSPSGLGVVYTYNPTHNSVKLSVRGSGSKSDANLFAEKYKGGGHPMAAGFYMTIDQFDKYLKTAKKNATMEA